MRKPGKKRIVYGGSILLGIVVVFFAIGWLNKDETTGGLSQYEMAEVKNGDIRQTVSSTGTVSAIETVEVGTQVSGIVERVLVDYNSRVKKGELLAVIETENLDAAVNQANAGLRQQQAQLEQVQAELDEARANHDRNEPLYKQGYLSEQEFRPYQTALKTAEARLAAAQAQVTSAKADVARAQKNRRNAEIYSPIDGVVIERQADEGQTVAASFNTPTLFLIAEDLSRMQIEADVDESDIGQIKLDQSVLFTVPAYPEETFEGRVQEIRLQPTTTQNVVNYTVVVDASNPKGLLLPGMTATVDFIIQETKNVLIVPSTALSITPTQEMIKSLPAPPAPSGNVRPASSPSGATTATGSRPPGPSLLWYMDEKGYHAIPVKTGHSDDSNTEIKPVGPAVGVLKPGLKIISKQKKQSNTNQGFGAGPGGPPPF